MLLRGKQSTVYGRLWPSRKMPWTSKLAQIYRSIDQYQEYYILAPPCRVFIETIVKRVVSVHVRKLLFPLCFRHHLHQSFCQDEPVNHDYGAQWEEMCHLPKALSRGGGGRWWVVIGDAWTIDDETFNCCMLLTVIVSVATRVPCLHISR